MSRNSTYTRLQKLSKISRDERIDNGVTRHRESGLRKRLKTLLPGQAIAYVTKRVDQHPHAVSYMHTTTEKRFTCKKIPAGFVITRTL